MLSNIIFGILLVFSGANVPVDTLPGWMQTVSQAAPVHPRDRGGAADRGRRRRSSTSAGSSLVEALIGVVYGVVGYGLIRLMETLGRRHATLERA